MPQIPDSLIARLQKRRLTNSLRELTIPSDLIDFCSNDYLGLGRSKELWDNIQQRCDRNEISNGATGSRLISGNSLIVEEVERQLAMFFNAESALLFNSGYAANQSILSAIPQRDDVILHDELVHASIKDGMRLSFAQKLSFKHNDLKDLERLLLDTKGTNKYVVVESIYSMDGDMCPIKEALILCQNYGAYLIVDEAHATGVLGDHGEGLCVKEQIHDEVFARIYTFGKAIGLHGACIVGSNELRDYMINFSRPFIYTTALPSHSVLGISEAFALLSSDSREIERLHQNIDYYRNKIGGISEFEMTNSTSPIQGVIIPGNDQVKKLANQIQSVGLDVRPILSPTVRAGSERLRICIHSYNTKREIDLLIDTLKR